MNQDDGNDTCDIYMNRFEGPTPRPEMLPFEKLTKLKGPVNRHLEALWADIKSLKEEVEILKFKVHDLENDRDIMFSNPSFNKKPLPKYSCDELLDFLE